MQRLNLSRRQVQVPDTVISETIVKQALVAYNELYPREHILLVSLGQLLGEDRAEQRQEVSVDAGQRQLVILSKQAHDLTMVALLLVAS